MNETTTTFGQRLAFYRQRARISQSELSRRAGYDDSFVSRLESGGREPTRDTVDALATALRLTLTETQDIYASAGFLHPTCEAISKAYMDQMRRFFQFTNDFIRRMPAVTPAPVARLGDAGEEVAA